MQNFLHTGSLITSRIRGPLRGEEILVAVVAGELQEVGGVLGVADFA